MKGELLEWLAGRDTGASSRALMAYMERDLTLFAAEGWRLAYPLDPDDLGRCIRLMDIEPSYRHRILEMASVSPQWARLAAHWSELETLYREEEPSGNAPRCFALMFLLIHEYEHPRYPVEQEPAP